MGHIYAEIELKNGVDMVEALRGHIDPDEVRSIRVNAMVDTGSAYMCINENIQEYLNLPVVDSKRVQLANGQIIRCDRVAPLEISFANRRCTCSAVVLPDDSEPLLGVIPMEDMDVIVHPLRQELIIHPDHGEFGLHKL